MMDQLINGWMIKSIVCFMLICIDGLTIKLYVCF